jgi:tetratricopeptide (TPR) repeat protein
MRTLIAVRQRHPIGPARLLCALAVAFAFLSCTVKARTQISQASAERVEMLRGEIKGAEERQRSAAEVGGLWLRLANRYQDQLEFAEAEDAFGHSLRLLRTPATQAAYADALDGLGSLYFETDRSAEAGNCLRKSLAIYQALGDQIHTAKLHETIALVLLFERRFHEAEAESAEGLKELQSLARADAGETVAAYLTHGCALCHQGRCSAALEDANRAMAIAQAKLPAESLDMVAVWLFRGFDEWKTGSAEEGERAMGEALRIARGLTGLPRPVLVNAQLGVLRQYAAFLKATHRKREAGQTESEIVQLESEQHLACSNCTVNAAALAAGPLLP